MYKPLPAPIAIDMGRPCHTKQNLKEPGLEGEIVEEGGSKLRILQSHNYSQYANCNSLLTTDMIRVHSMSPKKELQSQYFTGQF